MSGGHITTYKGGVVPGEGRNISVNAELPDALHLSTLQEKYKDNNGMLTSLAYGPDFRGPNACMTAIQEFILHEGVWIDYTSQNVVEGKGENKWITGTKRIPLEKALSLMNKEGLREKVKVSFDRYKYEGDDSRDNEYQIEFDTWKGKLQSVDVKRFNFGFSKGADFLYKPAISAMAPDYQGSLLVEADEIGGGDISTDDFFKTHLPQLLDAMVRNAEKLPSAARKRK